MRKRLNFLLLSLWRRVLDEHIERPPNRLHAKTAIDGVSVLLWERRDVHAVQFTKLVLYKTKIMAVSI